MTLREALAIGTNQLAANPYLREHAARDAEYLLLYVLGFDKARRYAEPERQLSEKEQLLYQQGLARRLANEPVQYITGQQEFYGNRFQVTPAVLIPRPETEHLVEAVLGVLPKDRTLKILDVGTGSGILAITLALHLPQAELVAVDLSPDALVVAKRNAEANQVLQRIHFLQSDLLEGLAGQTFDCIVSNPPYVPALDRSTLHPQVRDHEPAMALFAGPDGLKLYPRLISAAYTALSPGGLLALEFGHGQKEALAGLLRGWHGVTFQEDLQGISRIAVAYRPR